MPEKRLLNRPAFLSGDEHKVTFSYDGIVNEVDRMEFDFACAQVGLDNEIALLRIIIRNLAANDPADLKSLLRAVEVLALLLVVRHEIQDGSNNALKDAVRNVVRDIAVPIFDRTGPEDNEAAPSICSSVT